MIPDVIVPSPTLFDEPDRFGTRHTHSLGFIVNQPEQSVSVQDQDFRAISVFTSGYTHRLTCEHRIPD